MITFDSDTSYVIINSDVLNGISLVRTPCIRFGLQPMLQITIRRSKVSDLGNVRTERFPSIMNIPSVDDVIDVAAHVSWQVSGCCYQDQNLYARGFAIVFPHR
ncbi:MAG: hypothetical protein R2778_10325 [Saprospiraceae bacterium]